MTNWRHAEWLCALPSMSIQPCRPKHCIPCRCPTVQIAFHTILATGFSILKDGVELASFSDTPSLRSRGTTSEETHYWFVDSKSQGRQRASISPPNRFERHDSDLGTVTLAVMTATWIQASYRTIQIHFNPTTVITCWLKESGEVRLELFDVLGRKVATLVGARQGAGSYTNAARYELSTGMYFYRLQSGRFVATKKMLLVK